MKFEKSGFTNEMSEIWRKMQVKHIIHYDLLIFVFPQVHITDISHTHYHVPIFWSPQVHLIHCQFIMNQYFCPP